MMAAPRGENEEQVPSVPRSREFFLLSNILFFLFPFDGAVDGTQVCYKPSISSTPELYAQPPPYPLCLKFPLSCL